MTHFILHLPQVWSARRCAAIPEQLELRRLPRTPTPGIPGVAVRRVHPSQRQQSTTGQTGPNLKTLYLAFACQIRQWGGERR